MRKIVYAVIMLSTLGAFADTTHRVVPVSGTPPSFRCGDRCKFHADVPVVPLRVRVFRGTIGALAGTGRNVPGCIEFDSSIFRARNPRRLQKVIDLNFFFQRNWLTGNGDARYVFIVEHDDHPNGPEWERRAPKLRLPASQVAQNFRSGIDVILQSPTFAAAARRSQPSGGETAHMAMAMPEETGEQPIARDGAPRTMAVMAPRTTASNDCVSLQFDEGEPVVIRRAERRRLPDDPLKLADQRR
jgi:hypothetical protein